MKTSLVLSAALATAALASSASAARFYVQPSIAVAEVSGFDASTGAALAVGFTFKEKHSVELDVSRFSAEDNFTSVNYAAAYLSSHFEYEFTPLLLSYRYEFPIVGKWFGAIGASAGVALQEVTQDNRFAFPGYPVDQYRYSRKDEAFTMGFQGSVGYRFNDHVSAVLSAKSLRTWESDMMADDNIPVLQLGLNWRF